MSITYDFRTQETVSRDHKVAPWLQKWSYLLHGPKNIKINQNNVLSAQAGGPAAITSAIGHSNFIA